MSRSSEPCFRKTFPAVCAGLIPIPSLVIIALVAAGTLNSSAANFSTAVKGVLSGTLRTLYGSRGSDVSVILKDTFDLWERTRSHYCRVRPRSQGRDAGTDTYMVEPPGTQTANSRPPSFLDGRQRGPSRPTSPSSAAIYRAPENYAGVHRLQKVASPQLEISF